MSPRLLHGSTDIEHALELVGQLLAAGDESHAIVIVGGAALALLGLVPRATRDVDILAFAHPQGERSVTLQPPPDPLPPSLFDDVVHHARARRRSDPR
jgi:hypothetical protein